ncbi:indolepyruvate oxidoreductase subunit beta [Candidatus Fermentibacteria bacterium]|nr:indolepyruvate oxidoreductase subunit beta [Candidatus Fermentibacteria bacterium]
MSDEARNILLCGTGGQGILFASEVICGAALLAGFDVKKSEVHGMAQRGGSVSSHVRYGRKVWSPMIEAGRAHLVLALEKLEALRWAHFLRGDGMLLACDLEIMPLSVNTGQAEYPDVSAGLEAMGVPFRFLGAVEEAAGLGDPRVANTVMVGAAARWLGLPPGTLEESLRMRLPAKALAVNEAALQRGMQLTAGV